MKQALNPQMILGFCLSINNKPYEGLKQKSFLLMIWQIILSINNKPYEGLKQNSIQDIELGIATFN